MAAKALEAGADEYFDVRSTHVGADECWTSGANRSADLAVTPGPKETAFSPGPLPGKQPVPVARSSVATIRQETSSLPSHATLDDGIDKGKHAYTTIYN
jgi:hypothetical protein